MKVSVFEFAFIQFINFTKYPLYLHRIRIVGQSRFTHISYKVKLEIIADNWDPVNQEKPRNAKSEGENLIKCDTAWFCCKYTEEFKIASALFGCQSRSKKNFPKESVFMKCSRSPPHCQCFFDLEVSIQNGPCTDEVLETTEHAHHSKYHVSLL